jgi:hypothetical protein
MRSWTRCRSDPMTHFKYSQARNKTSHTMQLMTLNTTSGAPTEYGIRRGSDYPLWAPFLDPRSRRWLTRCPCWPCRGHWPDHLPSSCHLGWWRQCSVAKCEESQSRTERVANGSWAPPSHPSGAPSPSWGHPSSPHRTWIDPSSNKARGSGWSSAANSCCYRTMKWWPARRRQP